MILYVKSPEVMRFSRKRVLTKESIISTPGAGGENDRGGGGTCGGVQPSRSD